MTKGYSRILTEAELEADPRSPVCYLPNVIALHDDKLDKYRMCQDATAKVKGHSLNRYLLSGPDNLNNFVRFYFCPLKALHIFFF